MNTVVLPHQSLTLPTFYVYMRRVMIIGSLSFLLWIVTSEHAFAFSPDFHLGLEGHFSRSGVAFPSEFGFFKAGIENKSELTELDAELKMSFNSAKVFAISSRNFFHEFQLNDHSSLTIGRKLMSWSEADQIWGLGAFDPLDSWDRLRSFSQGLTGIFYEIENETFEFKTFASYLFFPEITPNVIIDNRRFQFLHPQAVSAGPPSITLLDRPTPLGYELMIPKTENIIFRPSFIASIANKTTSQFPLKAKITYGYLPLNYFPIAMNASASIPLDQVFVQLHPRLMNHSLYNTELNYTFTDQWSAGASVLIDQTYSDSLARNMTTTPIGTTHYYHGHVRFKSFTLSQLFSQGGLEADVGDFADARQSLFSSRVLYRNATQVQAKVKELTLKFLHEYSIDANWIAMDWIHQWTTQLSSIIGGDMISAEKLTSNDRGAEFLADLRGLDRIRLGLNYVF